jgi:chromosomal replication initiation ATPase DnaA
VRYATEGWNLEQLSARVAEAIGVEPAALKYRARDNAASNARKILAYVAYRQLDIPVIAIARFLGVGGSAVSMMLNRGAKLYSHVTVSLID